MALSSIESTLRGVDDVISDIPQSSRQNFMKDFIGTVREADMSEISNISGYFCLRYQI